MTRPKPPGWSLPSTAASLAAPPSVLPGQEIRGGHRADLWPIATGHRPEAPTGKEIHRERVLTGRGRTSVLLRSALALATRGWLVFPCVPGGKRPALRGNWQDLATTSPGQIRAWWARAPYNAGVACGPSGLVVIDLDVPHGEQPGELAASTVNGTDALARLCAQHGQSYPLPTYAVDTPSGGCHLYYAAPAGRVRNSTGRLGQLIDVRASQAASM